MANKFTRIQTTKSRYLEAENALTALTMITGQEALTLAKAGQELIGTNEELIYKYRDEFLYIQKAAERGLTFLNMLVEDPTEFSIVATAWGFTALVQDRFVSKVVYRKNLGQEEIVNKLSNINIDWSKPKTPTIDVTYYRSSGNAVLLEDSTQAVPVFSNLELFKRVLGIASEQEKAAINISYTQASGLAGKKGVGAVIPLGINSVGAYRVPFFPTQGGRGYRVGDTIVVNGSDLFGRTPQSNAVFEVREVDSFGAITNISVVGTAFTQSLSRFSDSVQIQLLGNDLARVIELGGQYG